MNRVVKLPRIILASKSPRRAQILETLGFSYDVYEPSSHEVDEHKDGVESLVRLNAETKALNVLERVPEEDWVVVSADTVVFVKNQILGKPESREQSAEYLKLLSSKKHQVFTGLTLCSKKQGIRTSIDVSQVTFRKIKKDEISKYIETREPHDKAGSYAVQGLGSLFIKKIEGSYTNVMGFPIELFLKELSNLTEIEPYEWFQ